MQAYSVTVPTQATPLSNLLNIANTRATHINLQAPEANAATVYFGTARVQPFELRPQANAHINHPNVRDLYIKGNGSDLLSILLT